MHSTILIFSDTHLTHLPDRRKLRFLMRIIEKADLVIINGDFWDSHLTTAQKFASTPFWQPLFKALKTKDAIYLYGNHDPESVSKDISAIFSQEHCLAYGLKTENQDFHIEHGNRITPDKDETLHLPHFILGIGSWLDNFCTLLGKGHFLAHYKKWNEIMKMWQKINIDERTYLICGHSHFAELSPSVLYVNSGSIRGRQGSYILVKDGKLELLRERY